MGKLVKRTVNLIIKNEAEIVQGGHSGAWKREGRHVWINQPLRTQPNLCRGGKRDRKPIENESVDILLSITLLMFSLYFGASVKA